MFDRGVTVFRIWGVPVRLHWSLLLFLPYVVFVTTYNFKAVAGSLDVPPELLTLSPLTWGIILAVGLFVAILLHELAHTAVALRAGAKIHSITLMMLGGMTRMQKDVPPEREAWMAFAGPLASFVIALLSYAIFRFAPVSADAAVAALSFATMNFVIAIFNLLPAFPMDGGRVLRGLLVPRMGRVKATRVATTVGKWMAVGLALLGILSFNIILLLIAGFVYMAAAAERQRLEAQDILHGLHVVDFMSDRLGEVHADDPIAETARKLLRMNVPGARVVEDPPGDLTHEHHKTVGVVTSWELARAAQQGTGAAPVQSAMHTDWPRVHPQDDASVTLDALASGEAPAVVVVDERDEVVGVVTSDDLRRALVLAGLH